MEDNQLRSRPRVAIIHPDTLAVIGLKQLLQTAVPVMQVEGFSSLGAMLSEEDNSFFHYFVAMNVVLENCQFFLDRKVKTIVLSPVNLNVPLYGFHSLCVNVPEEELVRSLLRLLQEGHPHRKRLPSSTQTQRQRVLSDRETEVLALIAKGLMNKEIANQLNIGLTTVITHRKNIMEKLALKSVSALTIYAVVNGYVDIHQI